MIADQIIALSKVRERDHDRRKDAHEQDRFHRELPALVHATPRKVSTVSHPIKIATVNGMR